MVIASQEKADVVREEVLGRLSEVIAKPGVEIGTHEVEGAHEFIVTVPADDEHRETIQQLRSLSAD